MVDSVSETFADITSFVTGRSYFSVSAVNAVGEGNPCTKILIIKQ